jgi:hypothetical protein
MGMGAGQGCWDSSGWKTGRKSPRRPGGVSDTLCSMRDQIFDWAVVVLPAMLSLVGVFCHTGAKPAFRIARRWDF